MSEEKRRSFLDKDISKLEMFLGTIAGIGLFIAYRIGIASGEKWPYALLLVLSIFVYMIFSESLFMKFLAVMNVLYSVFMLVQDKLNMDWVYNLEEREQTILGVVLFVFMALGTLMSTASGVFVLAFGLIVGVGWRLVLGVIIYGVPGIPKFLCSVFWSKVRGPIPDVQGVVKGDKKVYFHKDYRKNQIQLIYKQGSKSKIMDTYQCDDYRDTQYSLEWRGKKQVIVHKYNTTTSKQVEEMQYKI